MVRTHGTLSHGWRQRHVLSSWSLEHRAPRQDEANIYSPLPSSIFFSFPSSECKGITRSGEALAELVFLLVENYNSLTASTGLRVGWESLEPIYWHLLAQLLFFSRLVFILACEDELY